MKVQSKIKRQSNLFWLPEFMFYDFCFSGWICSHVSGRMILAMAMVRDPMLHVKVTLEGIAFNLRVLTISACDTVTWEHNDPGIQHTVTSGNALDTTRIDTRRWLSSGQLIV